MIIYNSWSRSFHPTILLKSRASVITTHKRSCGKVKFSQSVCSHWVPCPFWGLSLVPGGSRYVRQSGYVQQLGWYVRGMGMSGGVMSSRGWVCTGVGGYVGVGTHPLGYGIWDTVSGKWAVRILLECWFVILYKSLQSNSPYSARFLSHHELFLLPDSSF